jgi:hypothetical protein
VKLANMVHLSRFSSLTLLALAAAGCSASADLPEVVVTQSDVEFLGVPRIPGITDTSQTLTTSFDHPKGFELPDFMNPELRPLAATITGRGTMNDLSFLEGITLTLSSRAADAPPALVVANYERRDMGVGRVVPLETDSDADVLKYWSTEDAYYEVRLWGMLPENDWAIDVAVSFAGELSVSSSD